MFVGEVTKTAGFTLRGYWIWLEADNSVAVPCLLTQVGAAAAGSGNNQRVSVALIH